MRRKSVHVAIAFIILAFLSTSAQGQERLCDTLSKIAGRRSGA